MLHFSLTAPDTLTAVGHSATVYTIKRVGTALGYEYRIRAGRVKLTTQTTPEAARERCKDFDALILKMRPRVPVPGLDGVYRSDYESGGYYPGTLAGRALEGLARVRGTIGDSGYTILESREKVEQP